MTVKYRTRRRHIFRPDSLQPLPNISSHLPGPVPTGKELARFFVFNKLVDHFTETCQKFVFVPAVRASRLIHIQVNVLNAILFENVIHLALVRTPDVEFRRYEEFSEVAARRHLVL